MKVFLTLILMLTSAVAFGAYQKPADMRHELNNSPYGQHVQLGTQVVDKKVHLLNGKYTVATVGSTSGSLNLLDKDGKAAKLPINAIVVDCLIDVVTAPGTNISVFTGTAPKISFGTGESSDDLFAQVNYSTISTGLKACIPVGSAATAIKMTAERSPVITITSVTQPTTQPSLLTTGSINVLIKYILSE